MFVSVSVSVFVFVSCLSLSVRACLPVSLNVPFFLSLYLSHTLTHTLCVCLYLVSRPSPTSLSRSYPNLLILGRIGQAWTKLPVVRDSCGEGAAMTMLDLRPFLLFLLARSMALRAPPPLLAPPAEA